MGEKGNVAGVAGAAAAGVAMSASQSVIERVTDAATSTVTGIGQDFLETVKDKSVGAVADNTVAVARERLHRKPGDADSAASEPLPEDTAAPQA